MLDLSGSNSLTLEDEQVRFDEDQFLNSVISCPYKMSVPPAGEVS